MFRFEWYPSIDGLGAIYLMVQKEVEKELRYWSFDKIVAGEGVAPEAVGKVIGWVKKPVKVSVSVPSDITEVLELGEERIITLVQEAMLEKASAEAGTAPEGTFSRAMVSSCVRALRGSPQFKGFQRSALSSAVMNWVSVNEPVRVGMLAALESLRTAADTDDEPEA